jgi:aspartate aminotransferase
MTGWRIGWAVGPEEIIKPMSNIQSQSTSNPTSIAQKGAEEALNGPQDAVAMMVKEFDKRREYIVDRLNAMDGVSCINPDGAFYVFPRVDSLYGRKFGDSPIGTSVELCDYLLKESKVAAVPGGAFGADAYIRLSYATSMEVIQKGLDRIEEAFKNLS